jgi:hypothetical protein
MNASDLKFQGEEHSGREFLVEEELTVALPLSFSC